MTENAYRLGENKDKLVLHERQALTDAVADLIGQARSQVCIFSESLEPAVFNREVVGLAVSALVARNGRAQVRILVQEIEPLVKKDHILVGLMRHLSSFVEIRKTAKQHSRYDHAFVTVDDSGYYHRHPRDSRLYEVCYNDRLRVKLLLDDFREMWEQGLRATELLRLYL